MKPETTVTEAGGLLDTRIVTALREWGNPSQRQVGYWTHGQCTALREWGNLSQGQGGYWTHGQCTALRKMQNAETWRGV